MRAARWLYPAWAIVAASMCAPALAQRNLAAAEVTSALDQRVALVIGNAGYNQAPLKNPVNDAADVARALRELGWRVTLKIDATQRQMKDAIREFGSELTQGGIGLFYFAGHGLQYRGENYLVPVAAEIAREAHIEDETVSARFVLTQLEEARNRTNIVILDACRNNPFSRGFRSASRGLAQMDAAQGTLLAFATAPGSVAADGDGRNGVYTKHLLRQLKTPGVPVELMFKRVRDGVMEETRDIQVPWESSSLRGADFYFMPVSAGTAQVAPAGSPLPQVDPVAVELAFWNSVKESRSPAELKLYLDQYPQGQFAALARARIQAAPPVASQVASVVPSASPQATVYVYRMQHFMGGAMDYAITNRGRMLGMLSNGSYLVHRTTPGEIVLSAEGAASVSRSYEVEPGKTYYIEFSTGWTSVSFRLVDEKEGAAAMEGLRTR